MTYALVCGDTSMKSKTTYHGDTSEGELFTTRPGVPDAVTHVKAKRIGDCPTPRS